MVVPSPPDLIFLFAGTYGPLYVFLKMLMLFLFFSTTTSSPPSMIVSFSPGQGASVGYGAIKIPFPSLFP